MENCKVDFFYCFLTNPSSFLHYTFMSFLPPCKIQTTVIAFVTDITPPAPLIRAINHSSYPNRIKDCSIMSFLIYKSQYTRSLQPSGQQPADVPKCQAAEASSQ